MSAPQAGAGASGRATTGHSTSTTVGAPTGVSTATSSTYYSRESIESRRSEQQKLDDLSGRYGVDTAQRDARVPQGLRTSAAAVAESGFSVGGTGGRVGDGSASRHGKTLAGREILSQLILAHLDASRLTAPHADALRKEMKAFGLDEAYFVPSLSPLAFHATSHVVLPLSTVRSTPATAGLLPDGSSAVHDRRGASSSSSPLSSLLDELPQSPLYLLMCPQPMARLVVQQLLSHTYDVLSQQAAVPRNEYILRRLVDCCEQPMWSEPDSETLLLQRHPASGRITVATVNQLVEELTAVHVDAVAAQPAHELQVNEVFVKSFLAVFRCFLTPHALLAKLIQRYFVPLSFRIGDLHHGRGVHYKSHGESLHSAPRASVNGQSYGKRTAAWLKVQQLIRLRVLCVLGEWLRAHPHHFDASMLQSIMLFVEENCSRPAPHADCPSRILQASEFIKCRVALLLTSGVHTFASSFDPRLPPTLSGADSFHSCFQPPLKLLETLSAFQQGALVSATSGLLSGLSRRGGAASSLEAPAPEPSRLAGSGRMSLPAATSNAHHSGASASSSPSSPPEVAWLDSTRRTAAASLISELVGLDAVAVATHLRACSDVLFRYFHAESLVELSLSRASLPQSFRVHAHRHGAGSLHTSGDAGTAHPFGSWSEHERAVPFFAHALRLMCWCTSSILYAAVLDTTQLRHAADADEIGGAEGAVGSTWTRSTPSSAAASRRKLATTESVFLFFLNLTAKMIELNDMHAAFAIVSGMQHPAVARLHVPLFQPHLLFYDRIGALFELFDLESGQYAEHVAGLPERETHALIPLLHYPVDEIRHLDATYATFYSSPSAPTAARGNAGSMASAEPSSADAEDPLLPSGSGHAQQSPLTPLTSSSSTSVNSSSSPSAVAAQSGPSRSAVLIHWRKLQVIASIAEEISALQERPMHHELLGPLRMVYDDEFQSHTAVAAAMGQRRANDDSVTRTAGSRSSSSTVADVARAGFVLESSQFPNMTVNPQDLVALSLTVLP